MQADGGHLHHSAGPRRPCARSCARPSAWSDVAHNFRGDWQMLWKEITLGFLLAGYIALLGDDFFNFLFVTDAPAAVQTIENVIAGPMIAVLSFVCSIGNVPLAAVLWSGGISFAGVIAFIFADLIVLPIILAYRKYYGTDVRAADHRADVRGDRRRRAGGRRALQRRRASSPRTGPRPTTCSAASQLDYKLVLNVIALVVFAVLIGMTMRRGVKDPVCGMTVDRATAVTAEHDGHTFHFCSEGCREKFYSGSPSQ